MPKVSVDHDSNLGAQEVFKKIQSFFETDGDIKKLDPKITCQFDPSSLKGKANGSQFKADISVNPQGTGSKVSIIVDLPLLLSPFKTKVQETIQKKLSKYLG